MASVQIDRIEDEFAVLVHLGVSFDFPTALLPEGAKEGDTLTFSIQVDDDATEAIRRRIAEKRAWLSRDDDGGDFSL